MKIPINFKTPDALYFASKHAKDCLELDESLDEVERVEKLAEIEELLEEYISGGEYVRIMFDTDDKTVSVMKAGNR